jgi:hypothetical protein
MSERESVKISSQQADRLEVKSQTDFPKKKPKDAFENFEISSKNSSCIQK